MKRVVLTPAETGQLQDFLSHAGDSVDTFRYFHSRPLSIIGNHKITYLYLDEDAPVAYGHLDPEGGKIWLGVAVSSHMRGKGVGKMVMRDLISFARKNELLPISLSVDVDNIPARTLYESMGFALRKTKEEICFYELTNGELL